MPQNLYRTLETPFLSSSLFSHNNSFETGGDLQEENSVQNFREDQGSLTRFRSFLQLLPSRRFVAFHSRD